MTARRRHSPFFPFTRACNSAANFSCSAGGSFAAARMMSASSHANGTPNSLANLPAVSKSGSDVPRSYRVTLLDTTSSNSPILLPNSRCEMPRAKRAAFRRRVNMLRKVAGDISDTEALP